MNLNQLMNMILRIFIRKAVNKGINAGINKAGQMRGKPPAPGGQVPPVRDTSERDRIRAERRARRAAREAKSQEPKG